MKLIKWLSQWTLVRKEVISHKDKLIQEKEDDIIRLEQINKDNSITYLEELSDYKRTNEKLTKEIQRLEPFRLSEIEHKRVWYDGKEVRTYVKYRKIQRITDIANLVLRNYPIGSVDDVPLYVMKWLKKKFKKKEFTYKADKGEHWNKPETTLDKKKSDCDDYSILIYYIIREIFKIRNQWEEVKDRLWLRAGNVNRYGTIPSPREGHLHLLWEKGDKIFRVESTYYLERAILEWERKNVKENPIIGVTWFVFNQEKSKRVNWLNKVPL